MEEIPHGVIVVDPSKRFCEDRVCSSVKDGEALYFDDHHMSISGATLVVKDILAKAEGSKQNKASNSMGSTQ